MSGTSWEWLVLAGSGLATVVTALGLFIETARQTRGAADPSSDELWHRQEEGELTSQEFDHARGASRPPVRETDTTANRIARQYDGPWTPRDHVFREALSRRVAQSCIRTAGRVALFVAVIAGTILFMAALYVLATGGTAG